MASSGCVTGKCSMFTIGLENVCPSALVMCVAFCAATMATVFGRAASSGSTLRSQSVLRMNPACAIAHDSHPKTNTPRRPVEPPEATA